LASEQSIMNVISRLFSRPASVLGTVDDIPGSSLHAIARKRAALGFELLAHVYRYADSKFIVTSNMSERGSAIWETGEPTVLPIDVADRELGRVVCAHLLGHVAGQPSNLRDHKLTDWAVYRASGAKSGKDFRSKSWLVSVETLNHALDIEAVPVFDVYDGIRVKGGARPEHEELGAVIRKVFAGAEALRKAGLA